MRRVNMHFSRINKGIHLSLPQRKQYDTIVPLLFRSGYLQVKPVTFEEMAKVTGLTAE